MISIWFWEHLPIVITTLIVIAVVGYGFLISIAIQEFKEWKEFLDHYE